MKNLESESQTCHNHIRELEYIRPWRIDNSVQSVRIILFVFFALTQTKIVDNYR